VAAQVFGGITATGGATAIGNVAGIVHVHPAPTPVIPRQLPAPPAGFVGRADQLAHLGRALTSVAVPTDGAPDTGTDPVEGMSAAVFISALGGAGGVGKTWLALHWAHHNAHRFPDGQLFVDLHGFSPAAQPVEPLTAMRGFLSALGVDPARITGGLAEHAALYRSKVAGKRMLIVLDNAATTEQITPLLPGTTTCIVLVTSRKKLATLITRYGARHLQLDILTHHEAHALLVVRLGQVRVTAEPHAVDELIRFCGRSPLALAIMTRHAHTRPRIPLAEFATELRELGLDALDNDDDPAASLPTVLSWSLRSLTIEQRAAFALLGIAPGPNIGLSAAASLTGLPKHHTGKMLGTLEDASLLVRQPGGRYTMHDLIRAYATTHAHTTLPEPLQRAALQRVLDFYLHTAHTANRMLGLHATLIRPEPLAPGVRPYPIPDQPSAMTWLEAEHPQLLAAQHAAATHNWRHTVWHFAWNLNAFHWRQGLRHDALAVWQAALNSAVHLPDPTTRIIAHRNLGCAHSRLNQHEQGTRHLRQSLTLAEHHGDVPQQACTHHDLAMAWGRKGDDRTALDHARRSLDLYRALSYPVLEAEALNTVGRYAARLGEHDTARDYSQAALTLHRHHHNPIGEANTLDTLGFVDHQSGHYHQAVHYYQQALTLYRTHGSIYTVADTLDHLGQLHAALSQYDHARTVWQDALTLYHEQERTTDAKRVQQQLDALDHPQRRPAS
jgi:tetratricopeptide (TPR) repeat protein